MQLGTSVLKYYADELEATGVGGRWALSSESLVFSIIIDLHSCDDGQQRGASKLG